jgi:hypothetical protein
VWEEENEQSYALAPKNSTLSSIYRGIGGIFPGKIDEFACV